MLTDEDLIQQLEAGFREETAELRYAGRVPSPRRPVVPWTAVPIAAATAAVVVLPQLGAGGGGSTATPPAPRATQTVIPQVDASFGADPGRPVTKDHVRLVTASFEFGGRTFSYRKPAAEPERYVICEIGGVRPPADATPVPHPYDIDKAVSGTDPESGYAAVWVRDSRYFHDEYVEMSSPSFTEQELVTMLQTPPEQ